MLYELVSLNLTAMGFMPAGMNLTDGRIEHPPMTVAESSMN
jgi:hypothetical protein